MARVAWMWSCTRCVDAGRFLCDTFHWSISCIDFSIRTYENLAWTQSLEFIPTHQLASRMLCCVLCSHDWPDSRPGKQRSQSRTGWNAWKCEYDEIHTTIRLRCAVTVWWGLRRNKFKALPVQITRGVTRPHWGGCFLSVLSISLGAFFRLLIISRGAITRPWTEHLSVPIISIQFRYVSQISYLNFLVSQLIQFDHCEERRKGRRLSQRSRRRSGKRETSTLLSDEPINFYEKWNVYVRTFGETFLPPEYLSMVWTTWNMRKYLPIIGRAQLDKSRVQDYLHHSWEKMWG